MSKKLYAAFVPVLVAVAFVAVPAAAQALPQWYACKEVAKETGKFTTNKCEAEKSHSNFEKVLVGNLSHAVLVNSKNAGVTEANLQNEAKTFGITCKNFVGESSLWNSAGAGSDINETEFKECRGTGGLAECTVTELTILIAITRLNEIGGTIYDKYSSGEPLTNLTLSGAACPAPGTFPITGTLRGEITRGGKGQKFNAGESTLEFLGGKMELSGESEQEGAARGEGIFVK